MFELASASKAMFLSAVDWSFGGGVGSAIVSVAFASYHYSVQPLATALDSAPQSLAQSIVTGTVARESSKPGVSLRARFANS